MRNSEKKCAPLKCALSSLCAYLVMFLWVDAVQAQSNVVFRSTFPKIAGINIGGNSPFEDPNYREELSRQHLGIYGMWRGWSKSDSVSGDRLSISDVVADVRRRAANRGNDGILVTKYTIFMETRYSSNDMTKRDVQEKLDSEKGPYGDWWAHNSAGEKVSTYPETYLTNITRFVTPDSQGNTFPEWKVTRDFYEFFSDGSFDGVFLDNFFFKPTADMDWNGDGTNDSQNDEVVRRWYREGFVKAVSRIGDLAPNMFVMGNVTGVPHQDEGMLTEPEYQGLVTAFFEAAIGKSWSTETWGGWPLMMHQYQTMIAHSQNGVVVLHANGPRDDYAVMRYGLASTLMDNGYYAYSDISTGYTDAVWYDEFDVDLGRAVDPPQTGPWKQGVFMRRFEKGMAVVNPKGNGTQILTIPDGYSRISGTQDPLVNNGQQVTTVTLPERDGIILVRTDAAGPAADPRPPSLNVE